MSVTQHVNGVRLGIVSCGKATDALICRSLEREGFHLTIVNYKIPVKDLFSWIVKRIRERGLGTLIGHLLLAAFIRTERLIERIVGRSVWSGEGCAVPRWNDVRAVPRICFRETSLISAFEGADAILFLDGFRVTHRFFRRLKVPCLQIIWGNLPDYVGDSAGFWAFVHHDPVFVSLVERGSQFDRMRILGAWSVDTRPKETLRTVKVKQALRVADVLPQAVSSVHGHGFTEWRKTTCRIFYAPTLWTYLRASAVSNVPAYAFRMKECMIQKRYVHH